MREIEWTRGPAKLLRFVHVSVPVCVFLVSLQSASAAIPVIPALHSDAPRNLEAYEIMDAYGSERGILDSFGSQHSVTFKKILFWNEAYGSKKYFIGHGRHKLREAGCPVWQCETSDLRASSDDVLSADAIVFHERSWTHADLPAARSTHQRYVLWSIESPAFGGHTLPMMRDFFNWTMTFRRDSDIWRAYGWVSPHSPDRIPLHPDAAQLAELIAGTRGKLSHNYAHGKTRMAAWMVSHCRTPSGRDHYVKALAKANLIVDIFGDCGSLSCPRTGTDSCRELIQTKYKFYLSFENSLCADYVTEKFFRTLQYSIIPVVLQDRGHRALAPPHSYIDASGFGSASELAEYLQLLDRNDTLYNEYFWWKPHFTVHVKEADLKRSMCHLCALLHDKRQPNKVYHNMQEWWHTQGNCSSVHPPTRRPTAPSPRRGFWQT